MRSTAVNTGDNAAAAQYNDLRKDAFAAAHLLPHEQATPDLTLKVESGICFIGITKVVFAGGNSPSFTAPTTNPRIDLLVIDSAGTLSRIVGTEAVSPNVPTYPTDKVVVCEVFNRVGQTTIRDTDVAGQGYIQRDARPFVFIIGHGMIKDENVNSAAAIQESKLNFNTSTGHDHNGINSKLLANPPTGAILLWSTNTAPTGFLLCDGAAVSRTTYADLFNLIGTTYGAGDGSTTFNLPNLKGRVPVGRDSGQTEFDVLGEMGGAKTHTLSTAEMPGHSHQVPGHQAGGSIAAHIDDTHAGDDGAYNIATTTDGGGQAHNNLQPYIVLNYVIKF